MPGTFGAAPRNALVLELRELDLKGVWTIRPPRFEDDRGFFSETWNEDAWRDAGFDLRFVQDNHSYSRERGVLRGLHFQLPPFAQDKLVRVARGSVFDVALDIRRGSSTFGRWVGLVLSAEEWNQLLIPKGFAHGFITLVPETEVLYKTTAPYSPAHDRAIRFDDPAIGIDWPLEDLTPILSEKDARAPLLRDAEI
jgi:dTDP-4-dehydrorhamnose 3,5-epimerase